MVKRKSKREHPLFDYAYEEEVTFDCPVRGKVTQLVLIKRYKSPIQETEMFVSKDKFDELIDGYDLYDDEYEDIEE